MPAGLRSPRYEEIFVRFAKNIKEARQKIGCPAWQKYTYAVIDMDKYRKADAENKQKMMINAYKESLLPIAEFNHLDKEKILSIIRTVGKKQIIQEK